MADLAKARELAIKLGYINPEQTVYAQRTVYPQVLGRPPLIAEMPPTRYFQTGTAIEINRFALNPGEALYRQMLPGASFAYAAPTMFATGDLPLLTGSGVDPSVLVWCAWYLRHSAALTDSRAHVLEIIEESANNSLTPDAEALQTDLGRDRWQNYSARISQWVSAPPRQSLSDGAQEIRAQMQRLYGPGAGD
jgi:hypothetical protein